MSAYNSQNELGPNDLVFTNDITNNIHSGGFSVNSIMMKNGISPIMTLNTDSADKNDQVSDLFKNLVVPNWALSHTDVMRGGGEKYKEPDSDSESDDECIEEDLHDRLLELVKQHNTQVNKMKKNSRKSHTKNSNGGKRTRKSRLSK